MAIGYFIAHFDTAAEVVQQVYFSRRRDSFLARKILDLEPKEYRVMFPTLKDLSLSWVAFDSREKELLHALESFNPPTVLRVGNATYRSYESWRVRQAVIAGDNRFTR